MFFHSVGDSDHDGKHHGDGNSNANSPLLW